jgi:hypothetical protein
VDGRTWRFSALDHSFVQIQGGGVPLAMLMNEALR